MKQGKGILFTLLIIVISLGVKAQEVLSPLKYNARLFYNHTAFASKQKTLRTSAILFFDDFNYAFKSKYPDTAKWVANNEVYVNATYPVNPPSIGVATFDGLNGLGMPYDTATANKNARPADTLVSKPIDLSSFIPGDSIYLSFFYQPQGLGDLPNTGDSLVLEFASPATDTTLTWKKQWAVNSEILKPFQQVLVPVNNTDYFNNRFQFRFRNYASIIGNNDHWHIDYIKLATERSAADTILNDQAIQKPSNGILKTFREMPWNQFVANPNAELKDNFRSYVRNNYITTINDAHGYKAEEIKSSTVLSNPSNLNFNFAALRNDSTQYSMYSIAPILSLDKPVIKTTFYSDNATPEGVPFVNNDTTVEYQYFRNFYAYDDGSAEKAYGVLGIGARGAIRYHLNTPDSLQAIQYQFAHLDGNQSRFLFSVMVWKSIAPEQVLYEADFLRPSYVDTINGFATYLLDVPIAVSDTIYVGWLQSQQEIMNIGFDRNTDSHSNLFYNLSSGWLNSSFSGSLMIRPVLGKRSDIVGVGINDVTVKDITVSPNPVEDVLRITSLNHDMNFGVYSILGNMVLQGKTINGTVNANTLNAGLYFIKLYSNDSKEHYICKFIKS